MAHIDILGAGISGLWQTLLLQLDGHRVTLWDPSGIPGAGASRLAGAMLAPYCEGEAGHEAVRDLGVESLALWARFYPEMQKNGTLVVAPPRDKAELTRFASLTSHYRPVPAHELAKLEPALAPRFVDALFYSDEGHVDPALAMRALAEKAKEAGALFREEAWSDESNRSPEDGRWIVDCRGIASSDRLQSLRGVRGERIVIETQDVALARPVRMLHPRIPFYIVPWSGGRFMVGATVIESSDRGPPSVRSVLELLGAVYALNPAFGEARILNIASDVRPAFPDNIPKAVVRGRTIFMNGFYRHGFLLSPILAKAVADYIRTGTMREEVVVEDRGEW